MNREYLETLLKDFGSMLTTETVIGEPMVFGKVTIVPVVSVSVGIGSGGSNPSEDKTPAGVASAAGALLKPIAFLSIHEDGSVNLHHVQAHDSFGPVERLMEMAPGLIDKLTAGFSRGKRTPTKDAPFTEAQAEPLLAEDVLVNDILASALEHDMEQPEPDKSSVLGTQPESPEVK